MTLQGEGFAQTVRVPSYEGGRDLAKSSQNFFIVAEKKLNSQFFLLYLRYMQGRGGENDIWGRSWRKTSKYRHVGGGGLLKKPS